MADPKVFDAESRLRIVLSALGGERSVQEVCLAAGISQATYHAWRDEAMRGATEALKAARSANTVRAPA